MKKTQDKIEKFNKERGWGNVSEVKDLLLNMSEEIGEFWNIIKWVDAKEQEKLIKENMGEVENFIGDITFLALKIAHICGVDSQKAIDDVLEEYETRFPVEDVKRVGHTNKKAGGIDFRK
ncbi:MAG: hypothetical protein PHU42_01765 [Patescibacteria group bacterium]|nr:hypothetical protein [Patescibacteria group bacterium]